jgi:hypothetical protein
MTRLNVEPEKLEQALLQEAINRDWHHKYAKFAREGKQSLLVHSLNVASIARVIGKEVFDLDDSDCNLASLAGFLHDYQKAQDEWQKAALNFMSKRGGQDDDFSHDDGTTGSRQNLLDILTGVEAKLAEQGIDVDISDLVDRLLNIVVYTHDAKNRAESSRRRRQVGPIDALAPVIRLCDSIASMKSASDIAKKSWDPDLPPGKSISFQYHELSSIRGLVSSFLNQALIELMKEIGYEPLLHFGNGVAYILIGEEGGDPNPRQRLMKLIDEQFESFQESDAYQEGMTNAVLGPLTQTKWPCVEVVREKDIPKLIRFLSSMPAMNKPANYGKSYLKRSSKKAKYKAALDEFVEKSKSNPEEIVALMISDFNLLVFAVDFLKQYEEIAESADLGKKFLEDVNKWLNQYLGDFTFDDLSGVSNTTRANQRASIVARLWKMDSERLHENKERRSLLVESFIQLLKEVISKYKKYAPQILTESAKKSLLTDIHYSPVDLTAGDEVRDISKETYSRYLEGKNQRKRICSLCGSISEDDAAAALFGDGSQMFSNFIPGGTKIGAGRKAQVCTVCSTEATLRAFFFESSPNATLVLLPDLSLSPAVFRNWSRMVDDFARIEKLGLSTGKVWNMPCVYDALATGESIDNTEQLFKMMRPTTTSVNKLSEHLEQERSDPSKIKYEVASDEPDEKTFESLAKAHLSGSIVIDARHLQNYSPPSKMQYTSYLTPSHMFIFFRNKLYGDEKEADSTTALRTYLLSLLMADLFLARVIYIEGFEPLTDLTTRGLIRVPMTATADIALSNLGISSDVQLHQIQAVLQKMASLTLVSMSFVEKLGKDRLLRLSSMNRGAILRRAEMENRGQLPRWKKAQLIKLLEQLPAFVGTTTESKLI